MCGFVKERECECRECVCGFVKERECECRECVCVWGCVCVCVCVWGWGWGGLISCRQQSGAAEEHILPEEIKPNLDAVCEQHNTQSITRPLPLSEETDRQTDHPAPPPFLKRQTDGPPENQRLMNKHMTFNSRQPKSILPGQSYTWLCIGSDRIRSAMIG